MLQRQGSFRGLDEPLGYPDVLYGMLSDDSQVRTGSALANVTSSPDLSYLQWL